MLLWQPAGAADKQADLKGGADGVDAHEAADGPGAGPAQGAAEAAAPRQPGGRGRQR